MTAGAAAPTTVSRMRHDATRPIPNFDRAATRYDALNAAMSLGRDGAWRRALAAGLRPGERVLDLCCGSGRSAVAVARATGSAVVGADASRPMLRLGADHAARAGARLEAVQADALRLPFRDGSFDAVTVAWGLRNLAPEEDAVVEICRVLRPGGWLHVLDSPAPPRGPLGWLHALYLKGAVPLIGRFSEDPPAYRYLADSVLAFGTVAEVADRLARTGLRVRRPRRLLFGAAAVWRAQLPALPAPAPLQAAAPQSPTVQPARPPA